MYILSMLTILLEMLFLMFTVHGSMRCLVLYRLCYVSSSRTGDQLKECFDWYCQVSMKCFLKTMKSD